MAKKFNCIQLAIKKLKALINVFFFFLIGVNTFKASAQCENIKPYFIPGEYLRYEVAYSWRNLWINTGEAYFKADTTTHNNEEFWYFESYGQSYRFYDWIFKVRDLFKAYVSRDTFQPLWFKQDTYEGGYSVDNFFEFFPEHQYVVASTQNSKKPLAIDTLVLPSCTFDVLSAIYYARSLDFAELDIGEKIPIKFIIDGEFYELFIRYLGREPNVNRDGKIYDCIKFSAKLVDGTIFKGGEDLVVWVTDDLNQIPIMAEAKIIVGSVKAYLVEHKNLKEELKYR